MLYYSTNGKTLNADFKEATIRGQAPDKGLYFPEQIPVLEKEFIDNIKNLSREEIALTVIRPYVGDTISKSELSKIVKETIAFNFPLVPITNNISSLELFHGPTLAFKDVGARFMSCCLAHFVKDIKKKVTVLVATSGDTGGAVANGFFNVDGVEVIILYPSGKVSSIQELQLTTLGNNITALEIDGSFDDCQQMVKAAFTDQQLNEKLFLTSANSINVARWLPQQFYYFFALQQWEDKKPPVVAVPSGNFGNICAGLLAYKSGLPISHFIAACNANDTVVDYLHTGDYKTKKAVHTISNAMDVGDPSNFIRIQELFGKDFNSIKNILSSFKITDEETKQTIKEVYTNEKYLLDPHGAVGYLALQKYLNEHPSEKGFFLETAHPVKFYDVVEPIINENIELPMGVKHLLKEEKRSIRMETNSNHLKDYLLNLR